MVASTSRQRPASQAGKQKLYGYLRGYEVCGFTGSKVSVVQKSFRELIVAESKLLCSDKEWSFDFETCFKFVDKFLVKFYDRMSNVPCTTPEKGVELAKKAKSDSKILSRLISIAVSTTLDETTQMAICPITSQGIHSVIDLCDQCPYYLDRKFCIAYDKVNIPEPEFEVFRLELPEYKYLILGLVSMIHEIVSKIKGFSNLGDYYMLFEYLLTIGEIFEQTNPTGSARESFVIDILKLLKGNPVDQSTELFSEYDDLLTQVFQDVKEGKKNYIQDIHNALTLNDAYLHSGYDQDRDPYLSLKGTAQSTYTKERMSLISSAWEVDLFWKDYKDFDEHIQFKSEYVKPEDLDPSDVDRIMTVRTLGINNPNKNKMRFIHIGDNPTQDRCSYIHRRAKRVLDSMKCDCTRDHELGRTFLKNLTMDWFLSDRDEKIGIYGFDFSNATDTLDRYFQKRVVEFIFDPIIAEFWDKVSSRTKFIQHWNGVYEEYPQYRGQPQGLLGSFDLFALAHHFIFLMDMKKLGFENYYADQFYRVLGDDSVCNSIIPEETIYDPVNPDTFVDSEGIQRSLLEQIHFQICESFAGFIINYDKSTGAHYDSYEAKLDFAKVTFRNGKLFSPLPFRLAMNFAKGDGQKIAAAIWRMERGDPLSKDYLDILLKDMDPIIGDLMKCGEIPYLDGFKDSRSYNSSWTARVRYAVGLSTLSTALVFATLSDYDVSAVTKESYVDAFQTLFNSYQLDRLDSISPEHKIFRVLEKNEQTLNIIRDIYGYDDDDEKLIALACTSVLFAVTDQEIWDCLSELATTSRLLRKALKKENVDLSTVFPDFDMRMKKGLQKFSQNLIVRGAGHQPSQESFCLQNIMDTLLSLNEILGEVPRF